MSAGERLYRLLLRLYPADFRAQFASELAQWYLDRRRHESAVRVWVDVARDLFCTAPKQQVTAVSSDLRYALRSVRRAPALAFAVVGTVALAVTANTSMFSVVNAVLLRPLPFSDPGRLVQVAEKNDRLNLPSFGASVLNFDSWRERNQAFTELAGIGFASFSVTGAGEPEQFVGNRISPSLLNVLGVSPVAGRGFAATEEKPGATRVAMIGEGLWSRRFGRDPSLVGRTLTLDGAPATVVGIAPASLALFSGGEVYVPLTVDLGKENRLNHVIVVVGRLEPGVSLQLAQAECDTIASGMRVMYPEMRDWGIHLLTFRETFVNPQVEVALIVLFASVVFVLLIACANIANLLLARGTSREREIAVRTALGASRSRLVHQLLVESVTLSACGGAIGILASIWAIRAINASLPPNLLPVSEVRVDVAVLVFAVLLTIGTGVLFGLAPALHAAKKDVNEALKAGGRTDDPSGGRMRSVLAASEIALATVLLIGAGLFLQTFVNLQRARLGFDPTGLLTFQLAPPVTKYPVNEKAPLLYRELLESLQQVPAVKAAAVSSGIPFGQGNYTTSPVMTIGRSALPPDTPVAIDWRIVSPGYFTTMRISLLRGRDFSDLDGAGAPAVTIVSQATARRFWGDDDPLGRTLKRTADGRSFTVIGVVGDVRSTALNQESPALYYPVASRVWPLMDVVVRSDAPASALLPVVRQKVRELDPELPVVTVRTMEEWVSNSAAQPRLSAELVAVFALMALAIAAVGIYGVMAFSVGQRTRELGIRITLGARPDTLVWVVVKQGMGLALAGLAAGVVGAALLARAVDSLIYGVAPHDPRTMVAVAALLSGVALLACWVPARRAARLDPLIALRQD